MHEHIQVSLMLGRRTKESLAWLFHSFCRLSKGAFFRKSPISTGRNGQLRLEKITEPNWTFREEKKTFFNIIAIIYREHNSVKRRAFL